jgi:hypothetical protein
VGFEPTIPVFERAETFHAFGRAATAIGYVQLTPIYNNFNKATYTTDILYTAQSRNIFTEMASTWEKMKLKMFS